jgi:hypothetical protein
LGLLRGSSGPDEPSHQYRGEVNQHKGNVKRQREAADKISEAGKKRQPKPARKLKDPPKGSGSIGRQRGYKPAGPPPSKKKKKDSINISNSRTPGCLTLVNAGAVVATFVWLVTSGRKK